MECMSIYITKSQLNLFKTNKVINLKYSKLCKLCRPKNTRLPYRGRARRLLPVYGNNEF